MSIDAVVFMDEEVGQRGLEMESGGLGYGARADVSLHAYVVGCGHVADLLAFGDAAAGAEIRLDDLQ
jgi:hypothetical protein